MYALLLSSGVTKRHFSKGLDKVIFHSGALSLFSVNSSPPRYIKQKGYCEQIPSLFSMGHHLLPVPSNFPVPGHQVRHSALVAVDRLPSSHPVGMAMKSHDASEKGCSCPNSKWRLNWVQAANQGGRVSSCSVF